MAKKKHLKALIMGAVSLTLSCSMLIGTTFAWFTDSVTSSNNVIKSGNLDVELQYWTDKNNDGVKEWVDVEGRSDVITNTLWEPGTTEVAYLRLANAGSLAFKYQFGVNIVSETPGVNKANKEFKLSDYIYFDMADKEEFVKYETRAEAMEAVQNPLKISKGYNVPGSLLSNEEKYFAMVVYMPETVENEANHNGVNIPQINLGINVVATQVANENDSFGNDYDTGAPIQNAPEEVPEDSTEKLVLKSSLESNVTVSVPATVYGAFDDEVTSVSVAASAPIVDTTSKTVTFETLELVDQNGEEVDLSGAQAKVEVTLPVGSAFADGDVVEIYHDSVFVTYATVADGVITYEVSHFCEVTVKPAQEVVLNEVDKVLTINTVQEFVTFAKSVNGGNSYAGKTVKLGKDIDLAGVTWTPIGTSTNIFKGTFDGNDKTIKNLEVLMAGKNDVGLFGVTHDGEIMNVTVENAKVAGRLNVGVVAGTPYTSKYTNINVTGNVEVDGMAYVGAVGGKNAYADWKNVTVNVSGNSYVNANSVENNKAYRTYVGGVVGFNGEGAHTFKDITSNINVFGSTCDVGGAFGIAHYNNKFENVTVTGNVSVYNAAEVADADEMGGIAGVWHNENGTSVTFTNCKFTGTGKLSANVAVDLTGNEIVGVAYNDVKNNNMDTGILVIDGVEYVGSLGAFKAKLAEGATTFNLAGAIVGDVTIAQQPNVQVAINGNGNYFAGVITVDGKSTRYENAGLTIQNVNFKAESNFSTDAFIRLGHVDAARYTNNVTVKNCTFDSNGYKYKDKDNKESAYVAVKSYTGGDWNLTLENLTVKEDMHSLAQLKNVEKNLVVTGCKVYSKNGLNVNNGTNLTMDDCTFNVKGYAVRFGESANTTDETFAISNSTLKSACAEEGDAVIEFRKGATNATLTLTNTTITGAVSFKGVTKETKILVDGAQYYVVTSANELKNAITNAQANATVLIANDITVTDKWDNRYGGKTEKAITINGLGNTLKFTGTVNDGYNYHAVFRFEGAAVVKGLTFDMSEVAETGTWLRAISASSDLIVDNCTFIGSDNYSKDNAIVVGDTNATAQINASVSITNCEFINWRRGISDNENAKEIKSIVVSGNTFTNSNVYVSAYESVSFTNNVMSGCLVNVTSYTNSANATVVLTGNTLDLTQESVIGGASKVFAIANVTAQEGVFVNAK